MVSSKIPGSALERKPALTPKKILYIVLGCLCLALGVIGLYFMARKALWVPCIILGIVWLGHIIYVSFFVKTIPAGQPPAEEPSEESTES